MSNLIKKLIDFEMKASSDLQLQFFLLSAIRQNRVRSKKMHQKNGKKYDIQFITIQTLNPIRNTISACQKIFNFFRIKNVLRTKKWKMSNENLLQRRWNVKWRNFKPFWARMQSSNSV